MRVRGVYVVPGKGAEETGAPLSKSNERRFRQKFLVGNFGQDLRGAQCLGVSGRFS
jgi:hypothetical protein